FPTRTRSLRPTAPMVLRPRERGRVGRRRHFADSAPGCAFCTRGLRRIRPSLSPIPAHCYDSHRHDQIRYRHRRGQAQRGEVHAAQSHRGPEAQHHEPQAAVYPRARRGHSEHGRHADDRDRYAGPPQSALRPATRHAGRGASRAGGCRCHRVPGRCAGWLAAARPAALLLSARTGEGVDALVRHLADALPESPFLYPAEDVATQPLRFFASECIRETALEQLDDEVPYSVACVIEEFREERHPVYIRAVMHVERESQKRILIGHKGARIRDIGRAARAKIEDLVGAAVYLDLWVKVLPNWRRYARTLRRLGYRLPEDSAS